MSRVFDSLTLRTALKIILISGLVLLLFYYVVFQARLLILGPTITLDTPHEIVQYEPTITISGSAENIVSLSLNGRDIFTDERGHFEETLVLAEGYTIMTLTATDRYGRETILEHPFVRKSTQLN